MPGNTLFICGDFIKETGSNLYNSKCLKGNSVSIVEQQSKCEINETD